MQRLVELLYKCACMEQERAFYVRERRQDEDIGAFLEKIVQPALTNNHRSRSPLCAAKTLEYLKMPIEDNKPTW